MALINLEKISLAFGHKQLLDKVELSIEPKERICLVGRNGAGKSSFLKILDGQIIPDEGRVIFDPQLKMSRLDQDVPRDDHRTVYEVVTSGLGDIAALIDGYHRVLHQMETDSSEESWSNFSNINMNWMPKKAGQFSSRLILLSRN